MRLDVALPEGVDPLWERDLDNYLFPIARGSVAALCLTVGDERRSNQLNREGGTAHPLALEPDGWQRFTLGLSARGEAALKQAARAAVCDASELSAGPVGLQVALSVGSADGWAQTWKPLIDGLEPLLGSVRREPCWNPQDGRIVRLGIHRTDNASLGREVEGGIWARAADPDWHELAWLREMSAAERTAYDDAHRARLDRAREVAIKPSAVPARHAVVKPRAARRRGNRRGMQPLRDERGVVVFVDDDVSYLRWIAANPNARVLNAARSLAAAPTMHRATCHTISGTPARGRTWTGPYVKACAEEASALLRWSEANIGRVPHPCGACGPRVG